MPSRARAVAATFLGESGVFCRTLYNTIIIHHHDDDDEQVDDLEQPPRRAGFRSRINAAEARCGDDSSHLIARLDKNLWLFDDDDQTRRTNGAENRRRERGLNTFHLQLKLKADVFHQLYKIRNDPV
ncbi:unnamed protein product [Nippostrongylus brasiliensis]|uniref:Secreted protein n=1 Tax=Nippostrongylus brasiliensis TaxID=27835 RepID=A0A0N4YHL8_NIPBR|nr:hypothetical protein Q1695_002149 [Nippostrongylus brasiliensis]VDL79959.1 unnamed protein product [Nippostrongylus brasiliensis]